MGAVWKPSSPNRLSIEAFATLHAGHDKLHSPHGTDAFIKYGAEFVTAQARLGPDGHFAALEPLRKGGRRAPARRRRPAFEPPAPPPRPFFRSEYGLYFVPRAMLSAMLALLLIVARLPARAAARLSSRRGY